MKILETGAFLAGKFNSNISLIYIIEEKTLNKVDKLSDAYRTKHDREKTKKDTIRENIKAADQIIFDRAKLMFKRRSVEFFEEIIQGEFSDVIKGQIIKKGYDLILMAFEKECILNYRLFDEIDIPIWVYTSRGKKSILGVCSNLAPNQKVPDISIRLSKIFGWKLHMIYIVDVQDTVEVDINGKRSEKKSEKELELKGHQFVYEMEKKGLDVKLIKGSLEKEAIKEAERIGANLVVIGREKKKKTKLGLPVKSLKRKIAEKCKYSLLYIN